MNCRHCGLPLFAAQEQGGYKSCPHCSKQGDEHIFYLKESFGWTEKRITANNPDGIQSWCTNCRCHGKNPGHYADAVKCSEL